MQGKSFCMMRVCNLTTEVEEKKLSTGSLRLQFLDENFSVRSVDDLRAKAAHWRSPPWSGNDLGPGTPAMFSQ